MNFKMKMAFVFQPYFILILLGCFATYGYFHYAESKYMALIGVAIVLGNLYGYVRVLLSKAIIVRGVGNKVILTMMCLFAGAGQAKYDFGTSSSIMISIALFTLFMMDAKFLNEILKDSKFIKDFNHKPDLTLYMEDLEAYNIFKSSKERKIKFRDELYTYINNDIEFDHKGVKESNITYNEIESYLQDSMINIKDFNNDSVKTIEMLKY